MDHFRLCIALAPLALYLLVMATVNFLRRPVVISGARDMAALGLGVLGLMIVGPMELFLPRVPSDATGYVWMIMLIIYGLALTLGVLLCKPRIVVYNVAFDQLRPVLSEVVNELDPNARWAGTSASLPGLGIEMYLSDNPSLRNISLVACGRVQSFAGWRALEKQLRIKLHAEVQSAPNLAGLFVLTIALAMSARMGWIAYFHSQDLTQGFSEMMRF